MNPTFHMTQDTEDSERCLSADEAEARLCEMIMDYVALEKHWQKLHDLGDGLQLTAILYHTQMSAQLWDKLPDSLKRAAIKSQEYREGMVRHVVHDVVTAHYVEEGP